MPKVFIHLKDKNGEKNKTYSPEKYAKQVHLNVPNVQSDHRINFELLNLSA